MADLDIQPEDGTSAMMRRKTARDNAKMQLCRYNQP
jgi:hypothetical protein